MPGNALMLSLTNGILTDQNSRTGYIASNSQLQFDSGAQAGALQTSGFSVCQNGTLAVANSAIWYECLSEFEGRQFYNLYSMRQGEQCYMAFIQNIGALDSNNNVGGEDGGSSAAPMPMSMPTATSPYTVTSPAATLSRVSQVPDGQPQGATSGSVIYASSVVSPSPVATQITAGGVIGASTAVASSTVSLVSAITDGQVQAPTAGSVIVSSAVVTPQVTQISGGGVQAPTNGTSLVPFNPNGAPAAIGVGGWWSMVVLAGAIGVVAMLL